MNTINRCLYLDADHKLTLVEKQVPIPGPGQVLLKIESNTICGSDVHFYQDGRLGNFVVDQPYVPGHEASGTVEACGENTSRFRSGDRVVIEPGIACGHCTACKLGRYNLCPNVTFLSAPPVNGTLCDYLAVDENFVFPIPDSLSLDHAALAEPTAVAIHAVNRSRMRLGETGIIVGAGPIGLLTLLAFKAAGGGRAICVDLLDSRLEAAKALGADEVLKPDGKEPAILDAGDVVFETAGSAAATAQLFHMARAGGRVVQVGWPNGNHVALDVATMMEKELDYIGLTRYANVFDTAITWLADGRIDGSKLITHRFPLDRAVEAFNWTLQHPHETIKVLVTNR